MELKFVDPMIATYATLSEVRGLALFVPLDRTQDVMFVGGGEEPYAVFLSGAWVGESFQLKAAENWEGMCISGVTVEVDPDSAYSPEATEKQALSIVRRGEFLGLFSLSKRGGFSQRIAIPINSEEDPSTERRLGFTRWRLVHGEGFNKVVLRNVEALPKAIDR